MFFIQEQQESNNAYSLFVIVEDKEENLKSFFSIPLNNFKENIKYEWITDSWFDADVLANITKLYLEAENSKNSIICFNPAQFDSLHNIVSGKYYNCDFSNTDFSNASILDSHFKNCNFTNIFALPNSCINVTFENCSFDTDVESMANLYDTIKQKCCKVVLEDCNPTFRELEIAYHNLMR